MGFQASDLNSLGSDLARFPGVTGVWLLQPSEHEAVMWVAVQGLDEEAHERRIAVRTEVEGFVRSRLDELRKSRFIFDYFVLVDDEELGELQIPTGAIRVAA